MPRGSTVLVWKRSLLGSPRIPKIGFLLMSRTILSSRFQGRGFLPCLHRMASFKSVVQEPFLRVLAGGGDEGVHQGADHNERDGATTAGRNLQQGRVQATAFSE